ncbi:unnamed protein product [Cyclocybe aegerita]|uniref:Uncharacterized protein n=1 Tax=Cyclocybe aegerita TaxID=1973307 RepID=A0A8S0WXR3_CYCAE|nr:unnamed protein product [Cyclocybe aegerita]
MLGFRATRILRAQRGSMTAPRLTPNVQYPPPPPKKMEGSGEDFRPPWVYVGTRLISLAVIPSIAVYSIFFYDFGEREHVFQPVRRWAADSVNSFFTLSPAEEKLLKQERVEM